MSAAISDLTSLRALLAGRTRGAALTALLDAWLEARTSSPLGTGRPTPCGCCSRGSALFAAFACPNLVGLATHLQPLLCKDSTTTSGATIRALTRKDQAGVKSLVRLCHLHLGDVVQLGMAALAQQLTLDLAGGGRIQESLALLAGEAGHMVGCTCRHPPLSLVHLTSTPGAPFLPLQGNNAGRINM